MPLLAITVWMNMIRRHVSVASSPNQWHAIRRHVSVASSPNQWHMIRHVSVASSPNQWHMIRRHVSVASSPNQWHMIRRHVHRTSGIRLHVVQMMAWAVHLSLADFDSLEKCRDLSSNGNNAFRACTDKFFSASAKFNHSKSSVRSNGYIANG